MGISKFNIKADFLAYNHITANELKLQLEEPHQVKAGIFALCSGGGLKVSINLVRYRISPGDIIAIPPETFVQFLEASEDIELHVVIFSQKFIQTTYLGKDMIDKFHIIGKHCVIPLSRVAFPLYKETFTLLEHLHERVRAISSPILQILLGLLVQGVSELCPEQVTIKEMQGSKHFQQYRLFIRLVHTHYTQQHQVAFYAEEMKMKPTALCRLIKRESGDTVMEIINDTIIMDAKTQLRTGNASVKDIALSLGFNNAAFFNKFFKRYVGMTPQVFRNAIE